MTHCCNYFWYSYVKLFIYKQYLTRKSLPAAADSTQSAPANPKAVWLHTGHHGVAHSHSAKHSASVSKPTASWCNLIFIFILEMFRFWLFHVKASLYDIGETDRVWSCWLVTAWYQKHNFWAGMGKSLFSVWGYQLGEALCQKAGIGKGLV